MYTGRLVEYQMGEWIQVHPGAWVKHGATEHTGPLLAVVCCDLKRTMEQGQWGFYMCPALGGRRLTKLAFERTCQRAKLRATTALQQYMLTEVQSGQD